MNIALFNVKVIFSSLKKHNFIKDLVKYKLDIITIQETKDIPSNKLIARHEIMTFECKNIKGDLGFVMSNTSSHLIYWQSEYKGQPLISAAFRFIFFLCQQRMPKKGQTCVILKPLSLLLIPDLVFRAL